MQGWYSAVIVTVSWQELNTLIWQVNSPKLLSSLNTPPHPSDLSPIQFLSVLSNIVDTDHKRLLKF